MPKLILPVTSILLALATAGCHFVYKPDVQQGNLFDKTIDKNLASQLQPGLSKREVLALLGTPSVTSPFDQNRWDYVSTTSHRGYPIKVNKMSLFFNNDTLVRTEGSLFSQDAQQLVQDSKKYHVGYPVNETEGDKRKTTNDNPSGLGTGNVPNNNNPDGNH